MNLRDRIGIVHTCIPASAPDEGRTRCGQTWITFQQALHWQETQDEVDCMACIERKVRMDNLRSAIKDWRVDPLHVMWSDIPANITVQEDEVISIAVHDEIIVP